MFCDEPTTGLDSYSALSVIKSLKELTQKTQLNGAGPFAMRKKLRNSANSEDSLELEMEMLTNGSHHSTLVDKFTNKAIICSIHQPSSDVFECFTHIIIVSGGRIAFQGTVDEASVLFSRYLYYLNIFYHLKEGNNTALTT